jgi:hypothetical protein
MIQNARNEQLQNSPKHVWALKYVFMAYCLILYQHYIVGLYAVSC